jgi:hypothetical protein
MNVSLDYIGTRSTRHGTGVNVIDIDRLVDWHGVPPATSTE